MTDHVQPRPANNAATNEPVWDYEVTCPDVSGDCPGEDRLDQLRHQRPLARCPTSTWPWRSTSRNGSVQPLKLTWTPARSARLQATTRSASATTTAWRWGRWSRSRYGATACISGTFDNGSTRALGQIAVAQFTNPAGLSKLGNNTVTETPNSGSAQLGVAGNRRHGVDLFGIPGGVQRGPRPGVREHDHRSARVPGELADHHRLRRSSPGPRHDEAIKAVTIERLTIVRLTRLSIVNPASS